MNTESATERSEQHERSGIYGHGSILLKAYPESQRVSIEVTANNAVMDYEELFAFVDMIRRPRTITTVEELDALGVGSIVVDVEGDVCERAASGWTGIIKEKLMDSWLLTGAEAIDLPAILLHDGGAA